MSNDDFSISGSSSSVSNSGDFSISSSSSTSSKSGYVGQRNGFVSFLFGLVSGVGFLGTAFFVLAKFNLSFYLNVALYLAALLAGFIITWAAWRNRKNILFIIMLALSVPGYIILIGEIRSKMITQTAVTQNAEITRDVNFRKDPSTGDNIIRQLKQGDKVTLTGEAAGGWTQITHNGETGWVSSEFLKK
jgi:hypothetical protein